MTIKDHYLYPLYLEHLKAKRLSNGALELYKMSEEAFFDFKYRYDTDVLFKEKQDRAYKSVIREHKIDDIISYDNNDRSVGTR